MLFSESLLPSMTRSSWALTSHKAHSEAPANKRDSERIRAIIFTGESLSGVISVEHGTAVSSLFV